MKPVEERCLPPQIASIIGSWQRPDSSAPKPAGLVLRADGSGTATDSYDRSCPVSFRLEGAEVVFQASCNNATVFDSCAYRASIVAEKLRLRCSGRNYEDVWTRR
jgi:hypothetical protein